MRLPKDIIDVPRTIDVIPEQFLLDQQAREMADAFRLSPNVVVGDGYGGTREQALIRGFELATIIFIATAYLLVMKAALIRQLSITFSSLKAPLQILAVCRQVASSI